MDFTDVLLPMRRFQLQTVAKNLRPLQLTELWSADNIRFPFQVLHPFSTRHQETEFHSKKRIAPLRTLRYCAGMGAKVRRSKKRHCDPIWMPANLVLAPIWQRTNLSLAFVWRGAKMVASTVDGAQSVKD